MNQKNFMMCGLTGWCMEILFTSLGNMKPGDMRLKGTTSIWMFPIYGMASCIGELYPKIKRWPTLARGTLYSLGIMTGEFISGSFLKKLHVCPWDYSDAKHNIKGIVRLDYFPYWLMAGLAFERLLCKQGTTERNFSKKRLRFAQSSRASGIAKQ